MNWTIFQDGKKVCLSCSKELPIEEFVWMPTMPNNRSSFCRECKSIEESNSVQIKSLVKKINNETIKRFKS